MLCSSHRLQGKQAPALKLPLSEPSGNRGRPGWIGSTFPSCCRAHAPPSVSGTGAGAHRLGAQPLGHSPPPPQSANLLMTFSNLWPLFARRSLCIPGVLHRVALGHGHFPGGTSGFVRHLGDLSKVSQLLRGQGWDWARSDPRTLCSLTTG